MRKYLWFLLVLWLSIPALAGSDRSRIVATGGASTVEGGAGGGIVPMAVLAGYGAKEEAGGALFLSALSTPDYNMQALGASWSWRNRVEVSLARQRLQHSALSEALGVQDTTIEQTIAGIKVRLVGDLLYTAMPQISLGVNYKKNHDFFIPAAAGAVKDSDTEAYLAASKVYLGGFFGYNLLLNGVARYTRANQTGLVGFGGDNNHQHKLYGELSAGVFYNKHWLIGTEWKQKPDNLSFASEDDWHTLFVAWFANKHWAMVGGYVDLGEVATLPDQNGWYLSLQGSF
ncbi:MAG TPA: DUF3034 family protein [Cellvibrionaceae bacterium]